jgi:hypothetical protein
VGVEYANANRIVLIGVKMSWKDTGYSISHARDLSYYELVEMEESVLRCHRLFEKELPIFDTMYLLKILDYGELQRNYKTCGSF